MKRNFILLFALLVCSVCFSQYIGVRAKYTETRLVDDSPNPPKRENHLILSFYAVTFAGDYIWTPIVLSNYDIWVYREGLQYGNQMGGVLDSTGNNYPGYAWPAPRAVAYFNTLGLNYVDCDPNAATHYIVNGQELDCGFVTVSYHDIDYGTGNPIECFPAPNVLLPVYGWPSPYQYNPGNVNFGWGDTPPGPPYNLYNFFCGFGTLQLVQRGVLAGDSGAVVTPLPVTFAYVQGVIQGTNTARISWSNLTESDIARYEIQKSVDNNPFISLDTIAAVKNNSDRADYVFSVSQLEKTALYKIKAVEFSGKIFYSNIISLRLADTNGPAPDMPLLSVFPNPVTESGFTFRLTNADKGRYVAMMVSPDGKQVKQKMIEHDGVGDLVRQINTDGLFPGIYQLVLRSATYKYSQTIIVGY